MSTTRDGITGKSVTIHFIDGTTAEGWCDWGDTVGVALDRDSGLTFWPWAAVDRVEVAR